MCCLHIWYRGPEDRNEEEGKCKPEKCVQNTLQKENTLQSQVGQGVVKQG